MTDFLEGLSDAELEQYRERLAVDSRDFFLEKHTLNCFHGLLHSLEKQDTSLQVITDDMESPIAKILKLGSGYINIVESGEGEDYQIGLLLGEYKNVEMNILLGEVVKNWWDEDTLYDIAPRFVPLNIRNKNIGILEDAIAEKINPRTQNSALDVLADTVYDYFMLKHSDLVSNTDIRSEEVDFELKIYKSAFKSFLIDIRDDYLKKILD